MKKYLILTAFLFLIMSTFDVFSQEITTQEAITEESKSENFTDLFLNGMSLVSFCVFLLWAYIGVLVNVLLEYYGRSSKKTSTKFSFKYWWTDNWAKILLSLLLVPIAIVFCEEVVGMEINNYAAILIGGGSDRLIAVMRKWTKRKFNS